MLTARLPLRGQIVQDESSMIEPRIARNGDGSEYPCGANLSREPEANTLDRESRACAHGRIPMRHRFLAGMALVLLPPFFGCVLALAGWRGVHAADAAFGLHGGERVVFFGDSITQAGGYVADVEAYLLTRFPDKTFTIEWRQRIDRDATYQPDALSAEFQGDDIELAEIRRLCRPRDIHIQLIPMEVRVYQKP